MPSISASEISAAITVAGNVNGYVGVASVAGFFVGAVAHISNAGGTQQNSVVITDIITATNLIGLRIVQDIPQNSSMLNYGRSDMTSYGAGSRIAQPNQVVRINPAFSQVGYGPNGN